VVSDNITMAGTIAAQPNTKQTLPLGLLSAAGFLSVAGARIVDPLLSLIAHDFSVSVPQISIIIAAFTLPYGLNQLLLGPIGDRYGKLRVMFGALIGYTVFTSACAAASGLSSLTLLRACAGASSAGLVPVCLAYIGDVVPYDQRQITLSRFATGIVMAQIMAGPLGGAIGEYVGWRGVFLLLGAVGFVVTVIIGLRMRHLTDRFDRRSVPIATYRTLLSRSDARLLLIATAAEGALTGGVFPFVAPYLHANFELSYAIIGLVLACFGIGTFLYTRVARFVVPRVEEASLVLAGSVLIAAVIFLAFSNGGWIVFVPAQIAIGFGYFMMHTVLQSRATELEPDARSTAVAVFVFMLFLGQALGALAFGGAIAMLGYRMAFNVAAGGMFALGCWLWLLIRRTPASLQAA
jgi:YNFM family putative membrane transporter